MAEEQNRKRAILDTMFGAQEWVDVDAAFKTMMIEETEKLLNDMPALREWRETKDRELCTLRTANQM